MASRNPILKALRKATPVEDEYEDDDGLLKRIGSVGLSGLARIGNVLDLPGSSIRDAIAGENPFDQYLSPTTDQNRVSGRDLLRRSGLVGSQDTYGNFFGGLAAEIALDPTTYLTLGASAATKAGKVAQAAGLFQDASRLTGKGSRVAKMTTGLGKLHSLTDDAGREALEHAAKSAGTSIDELADEPLQSFAKVGIPFTDIGVNVGTGELAQGAAKLLDTAGSFLDKTAPVRYARGLFDSDVMGKFDYADQQVAREASRVKQAGLREARVNTAKYMERLKGVHKAFDDEFGDSIRATAGEDFKGTEQLFDKVIRLTGELGGDVEGAAKEFGLTAPSAKLKDSIKELATDLQEVNRKVHLSIEDKGGLAGWVENHVPRYVSEAFKGKMVQANRLLPTMHAGMQARTDEIRDIPAEIVNRLAKDEAARGKDAAAHIATKYGKYLKDNYGEVLDDAGQVTQAGSKEAHATALAEWIDGHKQADLFSRSTSEDMLKYQTGASVVDKSLDAIHNVVKQNLGDEGVSLATAYKRAWANPDKAIEYLGKLTGMTAEQLAAKKVPREVADAIVGVLDTYTKPQWMERVGGAIDKFNAVFKQNVTLPFPSFWARNFTSGQYMSLATGLMKGPKDIAHYGEKFSEAIGALKSGDSKLLTELFVEGVIDGRHLSEGVEGVSTGWDFTKVGNPLQVGQSFQEAGQAIAGSPSKIPGLDTARQVHGTALRTGEKASHIVEFMNRVPLYLYLKEKGWTPAAAAEKVKQLQVDYTAGSPFERDVVKRLVPFYRWQRAIAPVIAETLLERPGGFMAQSIRATTEASQTDATTPPHIASTLAVPNPFKTPEPGGDSYLTGFGLPYESVAQYAEGPRAAGREVLSQLNPLVKAPLEFISNQSFFQTGAGGVGRPLDELNPTIGQTLANVTGRKDPVKLPSILEFAAANSPAARLLTTARQVTDPRKTWPDTIANAITGVRVTDVSPATKDRALMDQAGQLMKQLGARTFSETYIPKDTLESLDGPQRDLAEKLLELKQLLAERRKERRLAFSQ